MARKADHYLHPFLSSSSDIRIAVFTKDYGAKLSEKIKIKTEQGQGAAGAVQIGYGQGALRGSAVNIRHA